MKVEKVMVRTMKRSENRQWAVKACLLDAGVPECLIKMHIGPDSKFEKRKNIKARMKRKELRFYKNPEFSRGHLCSSLSFYEALEKISLSNKTTMLMNDDKKLLIPFCQLQELLSELPYDAKAFQPQWYLHEEGHGMAPFKYVKVRFVQPYSPFAYGFLGHGDDVLIFTPKGAAWACKELRENSKRYRAGECILKGKSKGLYTSINQLTAEIGGQNYWQSELST